ncbi:S-methyl-5'-thioadenosine phosphorylase [compost metagenome]
MEAIGIIGGSGLYRLFPSSKSLSLTTEYGDPSAPLQVNEISGNTVYFLARHGVNHEIPPHRVNYRANIQALYSVGVRTMIATHALGALNPNMKPGDFIISDQFVNKTWGREDTFFNGPQTAHISMSDPFCSSTGDLLKSSLEEMNLSAYKSGTMLIIQGPRFSTKAENRIHYDQGCDVISMTCYPEVSLAREKGICYASLGLVTDLACVLNSPLHPEEPASHLEVVNQVQEAMANLQIVIHAAVANMQQINHSNCSCRTALEGAIY